MSDTHDFLRTVFAGVPDGMFELTYIHPDKKQDRFTHTLWAKFPLNLDTDFARVHDWNSRGYGVYFGCAVRKASKPKGQRGTKSDALYITALWCDLDNIPANEGAMKLLNQVAFGQIPEAGKRPCDPSIIISSGNGVHGYWLLDAPLLVTEFNASDIERTIRGIAIEYGQKADKSVADLARVMRLPGFVNTKPNCGAYCELMELYDIRRSFDRLYNRFAPNAAVEQPRVTRHIAMPPPEDKRMPRWVNDYITTGTGKGERTPMLFRAACWLFDFGWQFDEVVNLLLPRAQSDGLIADYGEEEVLRHIASAERQPRRYIQLERNLHSAMAADDHLLRMRRGRVVS